MQFFIRNAALLSQHASDADGRKGGDSQKPYVLKEGPRHFMDLEQYPGFATKSIPEDFSAVIARYDSATVFGIGIVPWAVVWTMDSLTAQLRRGDSAHALQSAADLGHYVGDAHQPLHCTEDFDGRSSLPGSSGIHSRYESTMIKNHQAELTFQPDSVEYVASPIDFMFSTIYQSNSYVDSMYVADTYARQVAGSSSSTAYYDTLWRMTKDFTRLQFQRATIRYADLLYTAWMNAQDSVASAVPSWLASADVPKNFWLGQNFPNPFNPTTTISYGVPQAGHVQLSVFTVQGRLVATLVNRDQAAGKYTSVLDAGSRLLSSGVYIYRLRVSSASGTLSSSRKLVLLK